MRLEVDLTDQVADVVSVDMVPQHGHGHNQRHQTQAVVFDEPEQLASVGRIDRLLQIPNGMLENISVALGCRSSLENGKELSLVVGKDLVIRALPKGGNQDTQPPVPGLIVSPEEHFVRGVKRDQTCSGEPESHQ